MLLKTNLFVVGKFISQTEEGTIWEFQGIFDSSVEAEKHCADKDFFVAPALLNEPLPEDTVLWPGIYYPKKEQVISAEEPPTLESCVDKLRKEQGVSPERALAMCEASMASLDSCGKALLTTDREAFTATLDKTTGFLTAPVKLARIGVQHYYGFELGVDDRAMQKIGVLRSPEEVFHPDSIKSFVNLVVTDDHPSEFVSVDNVKELQKGQVSEVDKTEDGLDGVVTVTDKKQIAKAKDGKLEVSVGYSNDLKELSGKYNGVEYEFVQTNIRANHLAIVDAGRCGPACKITMDKKKKEKLVKITVNGITFDTDNDQLAQAIQNQQSAHDAEKEGLKKKSEEDEEEIEKLKKEKDKAEAAKDALEKSALTDADISKMVSDQAVLLSTAKGILGDKMPECTDCPKEIKTAVIDHVLDMGDLSAKSIDYIDAMYDAAVKQSEKATTSLEKLSTDFQTKTKDGETVTRDSAREKYMKDQLKLEEV